MQMYDPEMPAEDCNQNVSRQYFQQYLDNVDLKDLELMIRKETVTSKGPSKINDIMKTFTLDGDEARMSRLETKRVKSCVTILNEVITNPGIPNVNASKYLDSIELDNKLSDKSLNKLYVKCRHHLEEESGTGWRWLPFWPGSRGVESWEQLARPTPVDSGAQAALAEGWG